MGTFPKVDGYPPIHIFASSKSWIEGYAMLQLEQVAGLPGVHALAAMPDLHPGKYGPVGCSVLANQIYPQLVGSDIGCGMGLFALDISARKIRLDQLAERMSALDQPWDGDINRCLANAGLHPRQLRHVARQHRRRQPFLRSPGDRGHHRTRCRCTNRSAPRQRLRTGTLWIARSRLLDPGARSTER